MARVLKTKISRIVSDLLANNKIYRQKPKGEYSDITYYYQNDKYYFVGTNPFNTKEEIYLVLDDFYQANLVGDRSMIVFNTKNSFCFISTMVGGTGVRPPKHLSNNHTFTDIKKVYKPIEVVHFGGNKLALSVSYFGRVKLSNSSMWHGQIRKSMIYYINDDMFIEDADEILKNARTIPVVSR